MTDYPPEPWHLAGQAYLSVWLLPVAELPKLPEGAEPLVAGGHTPVVTAWFDYRAPGQLSYHELLCATAIRGGLAASITDIWVDSPASLTGGRELWGIPKDLATLDYTGDRTFTAAAATAGDWIATAAFSRRAGLPAALPTRFEIAQTLDGRLKRSPVSSRAKLHAAGRGLVDQPVRRARVPRRPSPDRERSAARFRARLRGLNPLRAGALSDHLTREGEAATRHPLGHVQGHTPTCSL